MMSIKVLLADDHVLVREALKILMEKDNRFEVVGQAGDGREAVRMALRHLPQVVVMDVAMPGLNGVEATRQIRAQNPGVKVLALSMYCDKDSVERMFRAGATGFIIKHCRGDELHRAVRDVAEGKVFLSPEIAADVVSDLVGSKKQASSEVKLVLTKREREVLQLVAEGHTTKRIAASLLVSVKTIETHRRKIMDKLGLRSVAELTKYAIREGISSLDTRK